RCRRIDHGHCIACRRRLDGALNSRIVSCLWEGAMSDTPKAPLHAVDEFRRKSNGQVVLVLQGGGALGAYQVGVYEALHESEIVPDWVIGTSIGAINGALIAG